MVCMTAVKTFTLTLDFDNKNSIRNVPNLQICVWICQKLRKVLKMSLNWMASDYFSMLLHKDSRSHAALEMLVDDLHCDKDRTINKFLSHSGSEDFLWGLAKLLGNTNPR